MYTKFAKYNKKICGMLKGGKTTIVPCINGSIRSIENENACINESIKYILTKNIDSDAKNAYIYYILYNQKCQGSWHITYKFFLDQIDKFEYIFMSFPREFHFYCENEIILLENDKLKSKMDNQIAILGCGHNCVLNLENFSNGKKFEKDYYTSHNHSNIFTMDAELCKYPDLCFDFNNINLNETGIIQKLKNKFKILVCEGVIISKEMIKNLSFFLDINGIIISLTNPGNPLDADMYTLENFRYMDYNVENGNNDEGYPLENILDKYFPVDKDKLLQIMFENKVNIY
jgi:hypothetical protein